MIRLEEDCLGKKYGPFVSVEQVGFYKIDLIISGSTTPSVKPASVKYSLNNFSISLNNGNH